MKRHQTGKIKNINLFILLFFSHQFKEKTKKVAIRCPF